MDAARRLWPTDEFSLFGLIRHRVTSAFDDIDTKEAFNVRDSTHLALWICCCVSFAFVLLWCCDVFKLECLWHPWVAEIPGIWKCLYEVLGICIFATYFQDCLRMLLNYDGQHQELLQKKQKVLDDVSTGCSEVLERAQANAERLRGILVDNQVRRVRAHIRDVRANLVPTLVHVSQELCGEEQEAFEQVAGRLIMHMVENLQEPGQLAISLVGNLTEVYGSMQALQNEELPITPPTNELSEGQLAQLFPELARAVQTARAINQTSHTPEVMSEPDTYVQQWWNTTLGLLATLRGQPPPDNHTSKGVSIVQVSKPVKKDVVDHILGPVVAVLEIPELCRRWVANDNQETLKTEQISKEAWLGCGSPPWDSTASPCAVQCCVPIMPWFCSQILGESYVQEGSQYPKRCRFGGIWWEMRSRVHERLVFSFCASMIYAICYMILSREEVVEGCHGRDFWGCTWQICQSCTALIALLVNIPAIMICLAHMRRIDAVMDCESTIRKLEEIRRVVHTFDERTRTEEQRRILLEAVDHRVMRRIDLVDRYRSFINRRDVSAEQIADATDRLERCLQGAAEILGPAPQWLDLPPNWRDKQAQEFEESAAILSQAFDVAKPAEPTLQDAPQLALRIFAANGSQGDTVPLEKSSLKKAISCMRRCRIRKPKQCPPELLHVRGAASYVLSFPAVQWLHVSSNKTDSQADPPQREDSSETLVDLHKDDVELAQVGELPTNGDALHLAQAQQIVQKVCHTPQVFEKLNESGSYLQKAYEGLLPTSHHGHVPVVQKKRLQQQVLELMLLYLRYCGFKIKMARSVDGDQLLVTVRIRDEIAKCHASDLGYILQASRHIGALLGLGRCTKDHKGHAFLPYSAHLEECFKDRFGVGRLDLLLKIAMNAPDEFVEEEQSQLGDSASEVGSVTEVVVTPPVVKRMPFPALLLVTTEHLASRFDAGIDGFYKAWRETGEEWPQEWKQEGPPEGEAPLYRLVPQVGDLNSESAVFFMASTQMWTHTGSDGSVLYVCPGKKQTEVPTEGWIRPASQQEMEEANLVPSYFFDNGPFQAYFGRVSEGSIFRTVDHARLIRSILSEVFNLDEMQKQGFLTCHFVPHQSASLRYFKEHIMIWHPWHRLWPLEHIRNYFGEKVALDHDFLGFVAGMSFLLGLVALLQCCFPAHLYSRSAFGMFTLAWSAVLYACWRRRELKHLVEWGMEHRHHQPDQSTLIASLDEEQPRLLSNIVVFCLFKTPSILALWTVAVQWLLYLLQAWLTQEDVTHVVRIQAAVNALQMLFMDAICKAVIPRICKLQCNKDGKEFEDYLFKQMFIYRCIIAYTTLLMGCLVRPMAGLCAQGSSCDQHLGDELEVIFAIRILCSFVHDLVVIHRAQMSFQKSGQTGGYEQMGHSYGDAWQPRSYLEAQVQMPPRDRLQTLCDQLDVLIQLGYVLCFGILRPRIAIVLLFISLFRVRAHAWGLLSDTRRPYPETSQGLGPRNEVLGMLVSFAALSSSILLVLVNCDGPFGQVGGLVEDGKSSMQSKLLDTYILDETGELNPIKLSFMIVAIKYILTLLQSTAQQFIPLESDTTVNARKWQSQLSKQLRDTVLGVKEELAEPQQGEEQSKSPEQLIRDWVAGAQQLDMDDEDFEPAATAKLEKEKEPQAVRHATP